MSPVPVAAIINTAMTHLPAILALLRGARAGANPGEPLPTDEELLEGLKKAVESSIAKDDLWLSQHPE